MSTQRKQYYQVCILLSSAGRSQPLTCFVSSTQESYPMGDHHADGTQLRVKGERQRNETLLSGVYRQLGVVHRPLVPSTQRKRFVQWGPSR
jgi:hypothetical protein